MQIESVSSKSGIHYVLLIAVLLPLSFLFFIGLPHSLATRSILEGWNLGHIIYFALFPFTFFAIKPFRELSISGQSIIILLLAGCIGLGIELIQAGLERSVSLGDLFRDILGAAVAICFLLPGREKFSQKLIQPFQVLVLFLLAWQMSPTAMAICDEVSALRSFPVLSDFETIGQESRWEGKAASHIDQEPGNHENRVLHAFLTTDKYSGVNLKYFPRDWEGYSRLQVRLFHFEDTPLKISLRMHDREHDETGMHFSDRFNTSFVLEKGWNTVSIDLEDVVNAPEKRKMNLENIAGVGIFVVKQPKPKELLVDDVRLIR